MQGSTQAGPRAQVAVDWPTWDRVMRWPRLSAAAKLAWQALYRRNGCRLGTIDGFVDPASIAEGLGRRDPRASGKQHLGLLTSEKLIEVAVDADGNMTVTLLDPHHAWRVRELGMVEADPQQSLEFPAEPGVAGWDAREAEEAPESVAFATPPATASLVSSGPTVDRPIDDGLRTAWRARGERTTPPVTEKNPENSPENSPEKTPEKTPSRPRASSESSEKERSHSIIGFHRNSSEQPARAVRSAGGELSGEFSAGAKPLKHLLAEYLAGQTPSVDRDAELVAHQEQLIAWMLGTMKAPGLRVSPCKKVAQAIIAGQIKQEDVRAKMHFIRGLGAEARCPGAMFSAEMKKLFRRHRVPWE